MGDAGVFLLIVIALIIFIGSILGWMNYKIDKLEKEDKLGIETIGSIIALEKAMKKLNEALRSHDRRLDDQLHELSNIKERLDILESGHPDSDIDYGEVDDDANVIAVWFNGKKYIPEDKLDENTSTFYADNKVVAETTRPEETRCCATCQHYRPESGYSTCDLSTWLHVTKKYATMTDPACNNYEKASKPCASSDKGEVEYICGIYEEIGGNGETERLTKKLADLNYYYNVGLMSTATYMHRWEELLQK